MKINLSTDSKLNSSSEFEFLSSTDPTEEGFSDREIRKRTYPELMAPIAGSESQLQEIKDRWGPEANISLENILTDFNDLLMKNNWSMTLVDAP